MRCLLWSCISIFMLAYVLLKLSVVQDYLGSKASNALEDALGTKVQIGSVDLRLPNRLVIDNVMIYDQQGGEMLKVARISAAADILSLLDGKIDISSAQLFGMNAQLSRDNAEAQLNCQFLIDSLSSKDTTSHTPLDLAIGSLIIRNSAVSYDQRDMPQTPGRFNTSHIAISHLSSHIILHHLTDDAIDIEMKRLSLQEASGLEVKELHFEATASDGNIKLDNFHIALPSSELKVPKFDVTYSKENGKMAPGSLKFNAQVESSSIAPADIAPLLPLSLPASLPNIGFRVDADGTDKRLTARGALHTTSSSDIAVRVIANISDWMDKPTGSIDIPLCHVSESIIHRAGEMTTVPKPLAAIGDIDITGKVTSPGNDSYSGKADIRTSKAGSVSFEGSYDRLSGIKAHIVTPGLNIARIADNATLGNIKADLNLQGLLDNKASHLLSAKADGKIDEIVYNGRAYHNISIDGQYSANSIKAQLDVNDAIIGFLAKADINGTDINNIMGSLTIDDFRYDLPYDDKRAAILNHLSITSDIASDRQRTIQADFDFGSASLKGTIAPADVPQSFINIIASRLPAIPGFPAVKPVKGNYEMSVVVDNLNFIKSLVELPLDFNQPITINGSVKGERNEASIRINAPHINYSDKEFTNTEVLLWTNDSPLRTTFSTLFHDSEETTVQLGIDCTADDNKLYSTISWDNMRPNAFNGKINTLTRFYHALGGGSGYDISLPESFFQVGNALWSISANNVEYDKGALKIDRFMVDNDTQRLTIDGILSKNPEDSVVVGLNDIDVSYIMDLVNFHSVDFDGRASGTAVGHAVLGDLFANAALDVRTFKFQDGNMGDMHIDAVYSNEAEQIDITAIADDPEANGKTFINGYVSPQRNGLDLDIRAENTRLEFMQTFCRSFLRESELHGDGKVRLYGPFSGINLTGSIVANGHITLASTNCTYTLDKDTVTFIPDDIQMHNAPLHDMYGNTAYLTGGIHHRNLGRLSYDMVAVTKKFLAYDFPDLNGEIFCGKAIVDGEVGIHGKGNELGIDVNCTALANSFITYNATSPDAIASQDFIKWGSINDNTAKDIISAATAIKEKDIDDDDDILNSGNDRTNIRMHFNVNATPEARLHLIMDENTGDYIDLFGQGALRVSYYNKGKFQIFGNYVIDHGLYKMTIQNVIRRDFTFMKGGTIAFGGDPYEAALNMQARYALNSVSLADLSIGSSFKSNNVPVNCLMNITGTPGHPSVAFDMDLPTLGTDARQMVYSVINSEEEMNQQVLYLLAIGRFYAQNNNTADPDRIGQGTLAMQSFLSGTISQQFNNVMSQVMGKVTGNNNWSFGANIAPGNEGMSNAEYEGLLSGKALNNRLIFNGQFGYRDNVNTNTQNFIGDFNIQYLLTPNGTISLKAYNQTNDRYFTKTSLNTQGMGVVFQKEFGK